jgi:hypothetical protein
MILRPFRMDRNEEDRIRSKRDVLNQGNDGRRSETVMFTTMTLLVTQVTNEVRSKAFGAFGS